ncbi:hypothetical protein [Marinomonas algicola]|uniref:hypothetical protein n=1 Tax=Marinomonas algicola TaxID=2773454 RepID=UPI00174CF2C3|nr:hypothetical protein [Marinomonas algicola]
MSLKCFDILQLGLEPTMQALYSSATEKDFTDYILQQNQGTISEEQRDTLEKCVHHCINANTQIEGPIDSVLTQEQWQCWEANGF